MWRILKSPSNSKAVPYELRQGRDKAGYCQVQIMVGNKKTCMKVHRIMAMTFLESDPHKLCVAHFDGNKSNNAISNLRWATHQENSDDMKRHGTVIRGQSVNTSKLNESAVLQIKKELQEYRGHKLPYYDVAVPISEKYGVSPKTIYHIFANRTWKHVS